MKKVSIIIPVYNTKQYVEICIDSVLNQTYKNIEIIIVNDGSNADTIECLKELSKQDDRIKVFHFNENKGIVLARNFGMKKATGDFIYFLDSDDYLPRETIDLLMKNISSDMILGQIKNTYLSSSFNLIFKGLFAPKTYSDNKYGLLKRLSGLNVLFKRDFINENSIEFSESYTVFSDLHFLASALKATEYVTYLKEAVYFKRLRNDPITKPSLRQIDNGENIKEILQIYIELKEITKDEAKQHELDKFFLNYYRKNIISYLKEKENIKEIYEPLIQSAQLINVDILDSYDWVLKKEIKAIVSGNEEKFTRVISRHNLYRDIRRANTKIKKGILLYDKLFSKLPLKKNVIFFESFLGKNYSDSPKYIYEYMLEHHKDYKFVWSFNKPKSIPGNAIQVRRPSLRYFYYLARAKYWISNSRLPKYLTKREGNIFLQTWHGTPLKKLVFDMNEIYSADPRYKVNFYDQSRRWDFLSSPNEYSSEIFKRAFKFKKEMLEYGYPRNDILYNKNNSESILELKNKMNIPVDKKIVLYAPTWRDDDFVSRGKYNFELQLDLKKMQEQLGEEYVVLLRMHYFIANQIDLTEFEGFAYDFSPYDDIAELYLVSDMLITDYSSVFFDYANLQRPILFYMYDLDKYRDKLRGFYLDIETEVPGPILMHTEEIIDTINNIDSVQNKYKERYDEFYDRFCKWDDGQASEQTVKRIFE